MFFGRKFKGYHEKGISGLDILVLSIIKDHEIDGITGYDIIQKLENKYGGLWKTSAGTIYPLLSRLSEHGFVNIKQVVENNREKKLYFITAKGEEELKYSVGQINPNIQSLSDFIKTITKPFKMFSCFPFPDSSKHCAFIHEDKDTEDDYQTIKLNVENLKTAKKRLLLKLDEIDRKLNHYEEILKKFEGEAQQIDISDDDNEFENF